MDAGENPETAVARELMEETGYAFSNFEYLGKVAANPGVLNNFTHLFLATGGTKVTNQALDHFEDIEVLLIPVAEVRGMLQRNEFVQALHVCCLQYGFQKLDEEIEALRANRKKRQMTVERRSKRDQRSKARHSDHRSDPDHEQEPRRRRL